MLGGAQVNDAMVELLKGHPTIQQLALSSGTITDLALDILATMPKLRSLEIYRYPDLRLSRRQHSRRPAARLFASARIRKRVCR